MGHSHASLRTDADMYALSIQKESDDHETTDLAAKHAKRPKALFVCVKGAFTDNLNARGGPKTPRLSRRGNRGFS